MTFFEEIGKYYRWLGVLELIALVIASALIGWLTCWQIGTAIGLLSWFFKPLRG